MEQKVNVAVITMLPEKSGMVQVMLPKGISEEELDLILSVVNEKFKSQMNNKMESTGVCILDSKDIKDGLDVVDIAISKFKKFCGERNPLEVFWGNFNTSEVSNLCKVIYNNLTIKTKQKLEKNDMYWLYVYMCNAKIK